MFSFSAFAKDDVELKDYETQTVTLSNMRTSNFKVEIAGVYYFPDDYDNYRRYLKVNVTGTSNGYPWAYWDGEELTVRADKTRPYKNSSGTTIGTSYYYSLSLNYDKPGTHEAKTSAYELIGPGTIGNLYIYTVNYTYN